MPMHHLILYIINIIYLGMRRYQNHLFLEIGKIQIISFEHRTMSQLRLEFSSLPFILLKLLYKKKSKFHHDYYL